MPVNPYVNKFFVRSTKLELECPCSLKVVENAWWWQQVEEILRFFLNRILRGENHQAARPKPFFPLKKKKKTDRMRQKQRKNKNP